MFGNTLKTELTELLKVIKANSLIIKATKYAKITEE